MRRMVSLATPILRELSHRTQQSCQLAMYDRGHVVVVAQNESPTYYGLSIRVGARIGLFNTGSGHVLLAFTSEREREMMIREHELVPGETASNGLAERLAAVRRRGLRADGEHADPRRREPCRRRSSDPTAMPSRS
jgi:DNA-binding IclR family transcriptional regulator